MNSQNEELARRYFEAGNDDDLDRWDEICDPEMVLDAGFGEPMRGLSAVKQFTAMFHSALSDFFLTVHDLSASGDQVEASWTTGGIHSAPLMSPMGVIPATGRAMSMNGTSTLSIKNGKIVQERIEADLAGALAQLTGESEVGSTAQ